MAAIEAKPRSDEAIVAEWRVHRFRPILLPIDLGAKLASPIGGLRAMPAFLAVPPDADRLALRRGAT